MRCTATLAVCVFVISCGAGEAPGVVPGDASLDDGAIDRSSEDLSSPSEELPTVVDDRPSVEDTVVTIDRPPFDGGTIDVPRDRGVDVPRDNGPMSVPLPGTVLAGAQCHALLQRIGVRFTVAAATRGVVDPVSVTTPINGVGFHASSYSTADRPLLMDCRFAVALWHLTNALRTRWDVTDLVHFGLYNYRVIAGTMTLSQHAYAMALDLANVRTAAGVTHSVNTDFVMNGQPTCPPRAVNARDRLLKELACWMYDSRVFHIILTPNYNAAHRDHYHIDLTTGAHSIRFELPGGVDPERSPLFDWLYDDE